MITLKASQRNVSSKGSELARSPATRAVPVACLCLHSSRAQKLGNWPGVGSALEVLSQIQTSSRADLLSATPPHCQRPRTDSPQGRFKAPRGLRQAACPLGLFFQDALPTQTLERDQIKNTQAGAEADQRKQALRPSPKGACSAAPLCQKKKKKTNNKMITMTACLLLPASIVSDSVRPHGLLARQAPLSLGVSSQESWSRSPCVPPGDLPDPGVRAVSILCPALAGGFFSTGCTWEA